MARLTSPSYTGHLLLRIGVAFAFIYPPLAALSDPDAWIGYFPAFISVLPVDPYLLLHVFGVIEMGIAVWILWGRNLCVPAIAAALILLAIVLFNPQEFPILFRDVSIALAALALAFLPEPQKIS